MWVNAKSGWWTGLRINTNKNFNFLVMVFILLRQGLRKVRIPVRKNPLHPKKVNLILQAFNLAMGNIFATIFKSARLLEFSLTFYHTKVRAHKMHIKL